MKGLIAQVHGDEAVAALKQSESTADFVSVRWQWEGNRTDSINALFLQARLQELVDSSLYNEQELTIRKLTEDLVATRTRTMGIDEECRRLKRDNGACTFALCSHVNHI